MPDILPIVNAVSGLGFTGLVIVLAVPKLKKMIFGNGNGTKEITTNHLPHLEQKMDSGFERLDKKVDTKFDFVVTKLDGILYAIEGQKQENIVGTVQLRRHTDTLENHEQRIKKLELQPQE